MKKGSFFLNPYFQIFLGALFVTTAERFQKIGASETAGVPTAVHWPGFTGLYSKLVWRGIVSLILSFLCWIYVLKHLPLNVAFMLSNVVHVLVPVSCWLFLDELINLRRWSGIVLVTIGLVVVARPVGKIEEEL